MIYKKTLFHRSLSCEAHVDNSSFVGYGHGALFVNISLQAGHKSIPFEQRTHYLKQGEQLTSSDIKKMIDDYVEELKYTYTPDTLNEYIQTYKHLY